MMKNKSYNVTDHYEALEMPMSQESPTHPGVEPAVRTWPRIGAFSYGFGRGEIDRLVRDFGRVGLSAVQLGRDLLEEAVEHPETIAATRAALDEAGIVGCAVISKAGHRWDQYVQSGG